MDQTSAADLQASLETSRRRFLDAVRELRPNLHRFCGRMCGSPLDGEDVVQEVLAHAFYRLPTLRSMDRIGPWLFRIAHHKCIDHLRHERKYREETVPYEDEDNDDRATSGPSDVPIGEPLAALVGALPPKERAAVLLKDVLQCPLTEVAEIIDSTVGGVKAALSRGRTKLRALHAAPSSLELDRRERELLESYVDCFNRQDWGALRQAIRDDATVEVVDRFEGRLEDANYFSNYLRLPWEWKLSVARIDGVMMIVHWKKVDDAWRPHAALRISWSDGKIAHLKDYLHVDYLLQDAQVE